MFCGLKMASSGDPGEDPLNTSFCLLPPSYFDVPEPQPNVTEAINSAIGQQFERMARLSRQLEREREQLAERKVRLPRRCPSPLENNPIPPAGGSEVLGEESCRHRSGCGQALGQRVR